MSLPEGFSIHRASTGDLATLVAHRRAMFHDMGHNDDAALNDMSAKFRMWVLQRMNSGDYLAWLVYAPDGSIAAGTGLWLMDWPPAHDWQGRAPRQYPECLSSKVRPNFL